MGTNKGRCRFTCGPIWVHASRLLWDRNHEQYHPGNLCILLLFLVKHVINCNLEILSFGTIEPNNYCIKNG